MKKLRHQILFISSILLLMVKIHAQNGTVASGANIITPAGVVSYSIGQLDYTSIKSTGGSINEGLQQPFEIFILSGLDEKGIAVSYHMNVYPNPTSVYVTLSISNYNYSHLYYSLSDIMGKMICHKKTDGEETNIMMEDLVSGSYLITVLDESRIIKTFKIIKN